MNDPFLMKEPGESENRGKSHVRNVAIRASSPYKPFSSSKISIIERSMY